MKKQMYTNKKSINIEKIVELFILKPKIVKIVSE